MAKTYTTKQGDNWWEVARKNYKFQNSNPSPQELNDAARIIANYNNNVKTLLPGMTIKIPNYQSANALPPDDRSLSTGDQIRLRTAPWTADVRNRMTGQQSWASANRQQNYSSYLPSFSVNAGKVSSKNYLPNVTSDYGGSRTFIPSFNVNSPTAPTGVSGGNYYEMSMANNQIVTPINPNYDDYIAAWREWSAGGRNGAPPPFFPAAQNAPGVENLVKLGYQYRSTGAKGAGWYAQGSETSSALNRYYQSTNWRSDPYSNEQKRVSGGYSAGGGSGGSQEAVAAMTSYDQTKYNKYDPYTGQYYYEPGKAAGRRYGNIAFNVKPVYNQEDGKYYLMERSGNVYVPLVDVNGNRIEYTDAINLAANAGSGDAPRTSYASTGYIVANGSQNSRGGYYSSTGRRVTNPGYGYNVSMRW